MSKRTRSMSRTPSVSVNMYTDTTEQATDRFLEQPREIAELALHSKFEGRLGFRMEDFIRFVTNNGDMRRAPRGLFIAARASFERRGWVQTRAVLSSGGKHNVYRRLRVGGADFVRSAKSRIVRTVRSAECEGSAEIALDHVSRDVYGKSERALTQTERDLIFGELSARGWVRASDGGEVLFSMQRAGSDIDMERAIHEFLKNPPPPPPLKQMREYLDDCGFTLTQIAEHALGQRLVDITPSKALRIKELLDLRGWVKMRSRAEDGKHRVTIFRKLREVQ